MNVTATERDGIFRTDFLSFAAGAYAVLEPEKALEECWHHEAIAKVLVESQGTKTRKFINGPPRSLKSLLVSVAWVAYKLGCEPTHKFIQRRSGAIDLGENDSRPTWSIRTAWAWHCDL